jgi:hypothetical protein
MYAIDKAIERYGHNFNLIHGHYSKFGYVVSSPDTLCLARPCVESNWREWVEPQEADAWWIEIAIGRLPNIIHYFPFKLPRVGWQRGWRNDERPRFYSLNRLIKLSHVNVR